MEDKIDICHCIPVHIPMSNDQMLLMVVPFVSKDVNTAIAESQYLADCFRRGVVTTQIQWQKNNEAMK